jgi:hypothetical protein
MSPHLGAGYLAEQHQLRLASLQTIDQANAFLPNYLARHDRKFSLDYAALPNVHRPLPKLANAATANSPSSTINPVIFCECQNDEFILVFS